VEMQEHARKELIDFERAFSNDFQVTEINLKVEVFIRTEYLDSPFFPQCFQDDLPIFCCETINMLLNSLMLVLKEI
jgi:hypothetical protein